MSREITTVVDGLTFAECPRWHEGRIWFVDFYTHRVLSAEEDGSDLRTEAEVPAQPSGLGWLPDGRMLVVSAATRTTWSSTRRAGRTSATSAST
jgi:sugar lactone lactonase YvrE